MQTESALKKALSEIVRFLNSHEIPFMLLGGIAASYYGKPRQTFDIDIKIQLKQDMDIRGFVDSLINIYTVIPEEPEQFFEEMNVLPVEVEGVRIDFILATLPFEIVAIEKSVIRDVYSVKVPMCTPEDLIIQKAVSTRNKDWVDIETVAEVQAGSLDWKYILSHLSDLSRFLDDSTIMEKIERIKGAS